MIHKEGYPTIILTVLISFVLIFLVEFFLPAEFVITRYVTYGLCAFLLITVLQFFRNPKRKHTLHENMVIAPADGKVVVIENVIENEYFKEKRLQISIFMSPINVHVNRYPISGVVKYVKYHPGLYLVAWHPKSSTDNERSTIVVQHQSGVEVLFRQIAGALARRIVFYSKEGDRAEQCQEFGFIKFGSRVDIFLPVGTKVNVSLNQKVTGGQTVIAQFS